jgi:hypothetical protein
MATNIELNDFEIAEKAINMIINNEWDFCEKFLNNNKKF